MALAKRIHISGATSGGLYAWLSLQSNQESLVPLSQYLTALSLCWTCLLFVFFSWSREEEGSYFKHILFWALIFRAIGFFGQPIYEDDHFRYLWDGRTLLESGNPYAKSPDEFFQDQTISENFQNILSNINNPDIPSIYGPVSQFTFGLAYSLAPASLKALKLILLIADLLTLWILMSFAGSTRCLLLYAWCPLLIQETSFSAHIDSLGIFFLMSSLLFLKKGKYSASGAMLACSLGVKLFAALLAPFVLIRAGRSGRLIFFLVLFLVYLPFISQEGHAGLTTSQDFFSNWEFNSSVYALLSGWFSAKIAKALCLLFFMLFYCFYLQSYFNNPELKTPRGDWVFAVWFLFSAVVNPWYLLWLLPFAVLRPSLWAFSALAAVSLTYIHGLTFGDPSLLPYHHPVWLRPLEFSIIAIALLISLKRERSR